MEKYRILINYGKFFVEDNKDFPRYKELHMDTESWLSQDFAKFLCLLKEKGVIDDFTVYGSSLPF